MTASEKNSVVVVRKLFEPTRIRTGSWNIGSLTGKSRELVDAAIMMPVNILCIQETKWKGRRQRRLRILASSFGKQGQHQVGMV